MKNKQISEADIVLCDKQHTSRSIGAGGRCFEDKLKPPKMPTIEIRITNQPKQKNKKSCVLMLF